MIWVPYGKGHTMPITSAPPGVYRVILVGPPAPMWAMLHPGGRWTRYSPRTGDTGHDLPGAHEIIEAWPAEPVLHMGDYRGAIWASGSGIMVEVDGEPIGRAESIGQARRMAQTALRRSP